jgi:hypothetical protein
VADVELRADLPVSRWWWQIDEPTQYAVDLTPADLEGGYQDVVGRLLAGGWREDPTPSLWQVGEARIRLRKADDTVQVILDSKPVEGSGAIRLNVLRPSDALPPTGVPAWIPADVPLPDGVELRGVSVVESPRSAEVTYRWTGPAVPLLQAWGAQAATLQWYGSEQLTGLAPPKGRSSWYFQLVKDGRITELQFELTDSAQSVTITVKG